MALTLEDLFLSPDHYLHSFEGDDAVFMRMDRAAYRRSIFLDNRIDPAAPGAMRVPLSVLGEGQGVAAGTGWIFHVAHCGSTLLARALGDIGSNLVLREPLALRQMGISPDRSRLALVLRMVGKRYSGDGPTIVKANVPVNFILPEIAGTDPGTSAVMLYFKARDYLLAILRSDNHRQWLRNVTTQLAGHLGDLSGLADAERAAALWLAQSRNFASTLERMPHARMLDAEAFFADPADTLSKVAGRLGITTDADRIAAVVKGSLFANYSKNPGVAFDNADRLARRASLERSHSGELELAEAWLEANAPDARETLVKLERAAL